MTDEEIIQKAVDQWEKPHESENTLLIQRSGFDGIPDVQIVDRVTDGAWVLAWVYVETEEGS